MNFSKFKYAYSKDGVIGFLNILLSKVGFKFRFKNGIEKRIQWINNFISLELKNTIASGIYKGTKIQENKWKENDLSSKLLGLYEKEVQDKIEFIQKNPGHKKTIVNLGCADGYHLVGLLKNNLFKDAIIFEKNPKYIESLKKNLQINNISNNIKFFTEANENFVEEGLKDLNFEDCFFLIDIEGDEFKILNEKNLNLLKKSTMIIEFHEKFNFEEDKKFIDKIEKVFDSSFIYIGSRDLYDFKFLHQLDDVDRMLAVNEDRTFLMRWIFCLPKNK